MGLADIARSQLLSKVKGAIEKSYKQGRIIFKEDGNVEYVGKDKSRQTLSIDALASLAWEKLNNEFMSVSGSAMMSFGTLGIAPDDMKQILIELKNKEVKG